MSFLGNKIKDILSGDVVAQPNAAAGRAPGRHQRGNHSLKQIDLSSGDGNDDDERLSAQFGAGDARIMPA